MDRVDSPHRLSDVVPLVGLVGAEYVGWRTRAEHEWSPYSVELGMARPDPMVVALSPARRHRSTLKLAASPLSRGLHCTSSSGDAPRAHVGDGDRWQGTDRLWPPCRRTLTVAPRAARSGRTAQGTWSSWMESRERPPAGLRRPHTRSPGSSLTGSAAGRGIGEFGPHAAEGTLQSRSATSRAEAVRQSTTNASAGSYLPPRRTTSTQLLSRWPE